MVIFSYQIPQLSHLNYQARQQVIHQMIAQLSKPQAFLLNIIKLLILIPPFLYAAKLGWVNGGLLVLLTVIIYPLIMNPITYQLIKPKLLQYQSTYDQSSSE